MSTSGIHRIIGVHGVPRSGTSWLGQLFNSSEHVAYRYQPMFSYAFKDRLGRNSPPSDISRFFDDLLETEDDFVLQRRTISLSGYELIFPKQQITHLVYKEVRYHDLIETLLEREPRMMGIGLVRHPCAVIHSWSRAPREFKSDWNILEEWQTAPRKNASNPENWYGFERWKELATMFQRLCSQFPKRFRVVRYEALVAEPEQTLRSLFKDCDLPWTQQVADFLDQTRSRDDGEPYGVFRDAATHGGNWLHELDPIIAAKIHNDLAGGSLECYLATTAK